MPSFETATAAFGVMLIVGALLSQLTERSILSLAAVFVLAGLALGRGGLGWLDFDARSSFVSGLAFAALIVILFRDGLEVDGEMLRREWRLPLRKLVLAMPLTAGLAAVAAHLLFGLGWTESFLLGALLAPTDPVLTSSIVTNPKVPRVVRHSLNLESGLNDGLALPAVLALAAALSASSSDFVWWRFVLQDIGLGFAFGIACGLLGSVLLPTGAGTPARARERAFGALGVAFATYGLTSLPPHGNGLVAVFVAAIVLGLRRPELSADFHRYAGTVLEVLKLGIFLVFGSLLTAQTFARDGWVAIAFVAFLLLLARPAAVWASLIRTRTDASTRLFMGWFGPRGVATMTFGLLVLQKHLTAGARIFDITALVVICSTIIHGATDTAGARWIADRAGDAEEQANAREQAADDAIATRQPPRASR